MKPVVKKIPGIFILAALLLSSCASETNVQGEKITQLHLITGTYSVQNSLVVNAVVLTDMHGFVIRDAEWEVPVESQVLGAMNYDEKSMSGTFDLNLPAIPRGILHDVDNNETEDLGVQIFAVAYFPNSYDGPFAQGVDRKAGWVSQLTSLKTDYKNNDEITGGKLVIWSPDSGQGFPTGFGADGMLFTADDPVTLIPSGYSMVNLDQKPFVISQEPIAELTLFERNIEPYDFSGKSYVEAFDQMIEIVRQEYAFGDLKEKAPDWDKVNAELRPRVVLAEKNKDPNAFYLALRDFTWAFRDGHVALDAGQYSQQDFQTAVSGGYGFAIREFDDGRVFVTFLLEGGPAQLAGMQKGAEILEFDDQPISDAIDSVQSYSQQSSDFAIRYQKARYLLTSLPGEKAAVTFSNPDGIPQLVNLTAVEEQQSFGTTSVYSGVDRSSLLPVDAEIIYEGNQRIGYIRVNSNADDPNLTIRLFERALQSFTSAESAGIIIDMRYNNGGSSLGLAGFLTDQEIQMGQLSYYNDVTGQFEPEGLREKVPPNENQYRFDKTILLVGQACFSACEIEAYGFSQVPGMIVVGQTPTAGVEAETTRGQFKLPEGFHLTIPTGRLTLPDGSIFLEGQGVQPTLRVPIDETTAYASEDIVLQAGIGAVLQPLGAGIVPSGSPSVMSISESQEGLASGTPFLEDLARESYDAATFSQPGIATYTVPLEDTKSVIWSYVWCAADSATLAKNFESILLKFTLNDKEIPLDSFENLEVETGGRICRLIYTTLADWPAGEHKLVTSVMFLDTLNDGQTDFAPGEYRLEYTVYGKP